ncbi:hypothetical protein EVAR_66414_1 [Eumeta japonica]|uniref:Uncharacterized protein n=1 Tax=Eumeta variegata TaxID=151549 RepID=A0A4C2AAA4_EUMVA|nr:hypothetical protein EVAR_66414_1 [Eumeta japonica]
MVARSGRGVSKQSTFSTGRGRRVEEAALLKHTTARTKGMDPLKSKSSELLLNVANAHRHETKRRHGRKERIEGGEERFHSKNGRFLGP